MRKMTNLVIDTFTLVSAAGCEVALGKSKTGVGERLNNGFQ